MKTYTEAELIELHGAAVVPSGFDPLEFSKSLEEQREVQLKLEEEAAANPRRRSSHHGTRPKFAFQKKPRVKTEAPQPDADGWVTLNKRAGSAIDEEKETVKETVRDQAVNKIKTSSKKMNGANSGSSAVIAESAKSNFNAFAALNSDDESEEEESDEE